jgi:hypothetical protein
MPKDHRPKKQFNWRPLPEPISEDEVNIQITWAADSRTSAALERQAKKIGYDSANEYVWSVIVDNLVSDEQDSVLTDDGRIVAGWETESKDGSSKNVE